MLLFLETLCRILQMLADKATIYATFGVDKYDWCLGNCDAHSYNGRSTAICSVLLCWDENMKDALDGRRGECTMVWSVWFFKDVWRTIGMGKGLVLQCVWVVLYRRMYEGQKGWETVWLYNVYGLFCTEECMTANRDGGRCGCIMYMGRFVQKNV